MILSGLTGCQADEPTETELRPYYYHCEPMGFDADILQELKEARLEDQRIADLETFALALIDCLKDTRPEIRDGVGYEFLTFILRSQGNPKVGMAALSNLSEIKSELLNTLREDDPANVGPPFAALVLSEIARTDRIRGWMSKEDRTAFVLAAVDYMKSVKDYRGYVDEEGWRHGVAHGADWLLQLSLNKKLTSHELNLIMSAVSSQINADGGHAYIHGEPERLAKVIINIAARGHLDEMGWAAWLAAISDPAPYEKWSDIFKSESGLAQRHNVKAFLYALYVNAERSKNEDVRALLPRLITQINTIP